MTLNVASLDTVAVTAAGVLFRDCSWAISDLRSYAPPDDILLNMPVFLGRWDNSTPAPAITAQTINIDTTVIVDDCDAAEVTGEYDSCFLLVPDQKKIKLTTTKLQLTDLVPVFCRQRNITSQQLGLRMNSQGLIDPGNQYQIDFARWAMAQVYQAMAQLIAYAVIKGDFANDYQVDGLLEQLENGWTEGSDACGDALNKAQAIDWGELTTVGAGPYSPASPDAVTVASKTVTLWGTVYNVPEGLNFAEFLEELWIPKVEKNYTDAAGGVDMWEMLIEHGKGRGIAKNAACMQPCQLDGNNDSTLRQRYAQMVNTLIVELFPSGRDFPILESQHVDADTLWFGPRQIAGMPTYGMSFWNMQEYLGQLGGFSDTYGQSYGVPQNDAMIAETHSALTEMAEDVTMLIDFTKESMDCARGSMMAYIGMIATARHIWLKVSNITSDTFVTGVASNIEIDNVDLHA